MGLSGNENCWGFRELCLCQCLWGACQAGVRPRGSDLGSDLFKTHEAEQGKSGLELWELNHEVLGFSREALGQGVREDPGSGCF